MKTIAEIKIEKRGDEIIDISLFDGEAEITQGITRDEAISVAYYLLGLSENMEG